MSTAIPAPERAVIFALAAPVIYLAAVALGRALKRHAGVRLGILYQLFCIAIALFFPLRLLGLRPAVAPFDLQRELGAAAVLLGTFFLTALIRRYLWEGYFEQKRGTEIPKFLREVFALLIFLLALALVLGVGYKADVTGVLLPSTVVVGVVGFAMQDLIGNIVSGVAIQLGKPFQSGDWLIVDTRHAEVIEVNWRSTRLRTNDDIYLDIPNREIVRGTIVNLSYPTKLHAMRLRVGVDYNASPSHVKDVLVRAAANAKGVLATPAPKVFLVDFGDSAVVYEIKYWMENHALYNEITDAVRTNAWYALARGKIKIPFPIRTVQIEPRRPAAAASGAAHSLPESMRALLRRQPFFQILDDAQTAQVLGAANLCRYGRGETIIEQGAEGDSMFILAHGSAGVFLGQNGTAAPVATLLAGHHFGEMSLLTGERRSATVVASGDCDVLEIEKPVVAQLFAENPALLEKLSEILAQRRIENEGALASSAGHEAIDQKKQQYKQGLFDRVRSFFEL